MMLYGTNKSVKRTVEVEERASISMENELFSRKFKKKSDFILNSGNFYLTLQLELCPYVS